MRAELRLGLGAALVAFDLAEQRHREALDAFIAHAHTESLDQPSELAKLVADVRADREVAAKFLAGWAREVLEDDGPGDAAAVLEHKRAPAGPPQFDQEAPTDRQPYGPKVD